MPVINKKDRACLKETGQWTFWDTIIIKYYYVLLVLLLALLLTFFFWMEPEYDSILVNILENEKKVESGN